MGAWPNAIRDELEKTRKERDGALLKLRALQAAASTINQYSDQRLLELHRLLEDNDNLTRKVRSLEKEIAARKEKNKMTPQEVLRVVFNVPDGKVLDTIDRLRMTGYKLVPFNTADNVVPTFAVLGQTDPLPPRADGKRRRRSPTSAPGSEFITLKEAAAMLHIGVPAIYYTLRKGDLAYYKVGGRTLVKRVDIQNLILSGRRVGPPSAGDPHWRRKMRSLPEGALPTKKSIDIPATAVMDE